MIRFLSSLLLIALASPIFGQDAAKPADALAALRQTADQAAARWEALANGLAPKIAHLLPCDDRYRLAVEEVSTASDARLSALAAYLKAAAAKARTDTEAAKRVLAAEASLAGGWNAERSEAEQEGAAIDQQIADLKESMRKRSSLAGAEQVLEELSKMVKERAAKSDQQAGRRDQLNAMLGDLVVAYQNRETALEDESALLAAETDKWSSYYKARLGRVFLECAIVNPGATPRKVRP